MEKPISMIIDETKQSLISTLNGCQLHPSIVEMIVRDIYTEIHNVSMNVTTKEKEQYLQESTEE